MVQMNGIVVSARCFAAAYGLGKQAIKNSSLGSQMNHMQQEFPDPVVTKLGLAFMFDSLPFMIVFSLVFVCMKSY